MDKRVVFQMRCTDADRQAIAALAEKMGVKQSEAVRKAIYMAVASPSNAHVYEERTNQQQ